MAGHATGKADPDPHQGFRHHHHHHHPESLALPSFSTYTCDSSDVDANDGDAYSMEGSTNSDQNMSSGGGTHDGNGLSPGGGATWKSELLVNRCESGISQSRAC